MTFLFLLFFKKVKKKWKKVKKVKKSIFNNYWCNIFSSYPSVFQSSTSHSLDLFDIQALSHSLNTVGSRFCALSSRANAHTLRWVLALHNITVPMLMCTRWGWPTHAPGAQLVGSPISTRGPLAVQVKHMVKELSEDGQKNEDDQRCWEIMYAPSTSSQYWYGSTFAVQRIMIQWSSREV